MRGGAQSHLMRCSDEAYYVVKFQNNPQGVRILANELLGTRLAARMGLPTPAAAVVEVRENADRTDRGPGNSTGAREAARAARDCNLVRGIRGSRRRRWSTIFLPDEQLREVVNLADFCGMLVFDKWTCNTNGRQAIFLRAKGASRYHAQMIDQGFCFNAGEWNFPDAPLRGLYARHRVYESVRGVEVVRSVARARRRENVRRKCWTKLSGNSAGVVRL